MPELNKWQPGKFKITLDPAGIDAMTALNDRLGNIDEKSNCGSIRTMDRFANFLESCSAWFLRMAEKVRNSTAKIDAPCLITLPKKAASISENTKK